MDGALKIPKNTVHEQQVIITRASGIAHIARQKILYPYPLAIQNFIAPRHDKVSKIKSVETR